MFAEEDGNTQCSKLGMEMCLWFLSEACKDSLVANVKRSTLRTVNAHISTWYAQLAALVIFSVKINKNKRFSQAKNVLIIL